MAHLNPDDPQLLGQIVAVLQNTMSANGVDRGAAETSLRDAQHLVDKQTGFVQVLLTLATAETLDAPVRMAACTTLKNTILHGWNVRSAEHLIQEADKAWFRSRILDALLAAPKFTRPLLSTMITTVADVDFPQQWPEILTVLVERITATVAAAASTPNAVTVLGGCLSTAHSIFTRYRAVDDITQDIANEVKVINNVFTMPMLAVLEFAAASTKSSIAAANGELATASVSLFTAAVQTFQDLTCLDLGDEHIKNLPRFMTTLLAGLQVQSASPALAEEIIALRSNIMECVTQHLTRFDEDFEPFAQQFTATVWEMLKDPANAGGDADDLVIEMMNFLIAVSRGPQAALLEKAETLKQLCEEVILPNMKLSEDEVDCFADEPDAYIQRDVEGSDLHTRRRASCDLTRALLERFAAQVGPLFKDYVGVLLAQGTWSAKNTAIFLVIALALKGTSSSVRGAGTINELVPIGEFFAAQILPELADFNVGPTGHAIIKADAIRFVATFRQHIPATEYPALMARLAVAITSEETVVRTYAAHAVERLMTVHDDGVYRVNEATFAPLAATVLAQLCTRLGADRRPNEYLMQCLMRVMRQVPTCAVPFVGDIMNVMAGVLAEQAKNPSNPLFNHYMFEVLSSGIAVDPSKAPLIQAVLWETLMSILVNDVLEFLPYTLQILAQLLDATPAGAPVPDAYMLIYDPLLRPEMYVQTGNVPAVTRLLCSFIRRGAAQIEAAAATQKTLGVFQKLVASKHQDHYGFELLSAMLMHFPPALMDPVLPTIFQILFARQTNAKTPKFTKCFALFVATVIARRGADALRQILEAIQPDIYFGVLEKILLPTVAKIAGAVERKLCAVALTSVLCDSQALLAPARHPLFAACVLQTLTVIHFGVQADEPDAANFVPVHAKVADLPSTTAAEGFKNQYCPLRAAERPPEDLCADVADANQHFKAKVAPVLQQQQALAQVLQAALPADAYQALMALA
jgi:exportin-2 (importin alpha re-exporter)